DSEDDEQQVVEPQLEGANRQPGKDESREDRSGDPDRLPADGTIADVEQRIEVERDDGGRHGAGQCTGGSSPQTVPSRRCPADPNRSTALCRLDDTPGVYSALTRAA